MSDVLRRFETKATLKQQGSKIEALFRPCKNYGRDDELSELILPVHPWIKPLMWHLSAVWKIRETRCQKHLTAK